MQAVTKNILKFTATGLVAGVALGWLLSLGSENYFVTLGVATLGLFVGVILGIVHRNDAWRFVSWRNIPISPTTGF